MPTCPNGHLVANDDAMCGACGAATVEVQPVPLRSAGHPSRDSNDRFCAQRGSPVITGIALPEVVAAAPAPPAQTTPPAPSAPSAHMTPPTPPAPPGLVGRRSYGPWAVRSSSGYRLR